MRAVKTEIKVLEGDRCTVTQLVLTNGAGATVTFTGDAKLHPKDSYDPEIGLRYAMSRMFQQAATAFRIDAEDRVRYNERIGR